MRTIFLPLILLGALTVSGAALGNEVSLHKHSADELKTVCQKAGGKFSQDARAYGCGSDCHGEPGTDCVVTCISADQNCTGQVIGARRPKNLLSALQAPPGSPR